MQLETIHYTAKGRAAGRDRELLALARRLEQIIGRVPGPTGFQAASTPDIGAAAL
jgi:hypothetical protein